MRSRKMIRIALTAERNKRKMCRVESDKAGSANAALAVLFKKGSHDDFCDRRATGFHRARFSAQFFHTQTGVGFQRNAGCAIHHEPYPMDPGRSALSPGSWSSAGQAGHTSSGETKYQRLIKILRFTFWANRTGFSHNGQFEECEGTACL